jgi:hypothetical protein
MIDAAMMNTPPLNRIMRLIFLFRPISTLHRSYIIGLSVKKSFEQGRKMKVELTGKGMNNKKTSVSTLRIITTRMYTFEIVSWQKSIDEIVSSCLPTRSEAEY